MEELAQGVLWDNAAASSLLQEVAMASVTQLSGRC